MANLEGQLVLRHVTEVAAATESAAKVVIPASETWELDLFQGNAGFDLNTAAGVIWDYSGTQQLLGLTHGEKDIDLTGLELTGDGVKELAVVLINDLPDTHTLGGTLFGRRFSP